MYVSMQWQYDAVLKFQALSHSVYFVAVSVPSLDFCMIALRNLMDLEHISLRSVFQPRHMMQELTIHPPVPSTYVATWCHAMPYVAIAET